MYISAIEQCIHINFLSDFERSVCCFDFTVTLYTSMFVSPSYLFSLYDIIKSTIHLLESRNEWTAGIYIKISWINLFFRYFISLDLSNVLNHKRLM